MAQTVNLDHRYRDKKWIIEQKKAGYYHYQIAEMCGVKPCTLKKWTKRLGIKSNKGPHNLDKPRILATGKKFGSITIGSFIRYDKHGSARVAMYEYTCNCGNTGITNLHHLYNKLQCWTCSNKKRRGVLTNKTVAQGDTMYRILARYKLDARNRNHSWELSKAEFRILTSSNCYYCGAVPSNIKRTDKNNYLLYEYIYNGIDRVDNTKGYTKDNCVACCTICNLAKRNMSLDTFITWIENLVLYRNNLNKYK